MTKYELKRVHTPAYSLRQFAKDLGLTASNLSDVLKGRCGLSSSVAARIADILGMSEFERNVFVDLVVSQHARSRSERESAQKRLEIHTRDPFLQKLGPDQTTVVEKWFYLATLELIVLSKGEIKNEELASKLEITTSQVREAVDKLVELNLIKQNASGRWERTNTHVFAESRVPSMSIRNFHRQVLELAKDGLNQPIEERKYLSTMMAIDSNRLPEIRAFLAEMDKEFFKRFEGSKDADCLYNFGLQFFRLDHQEEVSDEKQH